MIKDWKRQIKHKLINFLQEFQNVCLNCDRKTEDIRVLFATKYLNPEQFVAFLEVAKETNIVPIMIGENRVQDWIDKSIFARGTLANDVGTMQIGIRLEELCTPILIGNLQKNKINKAIKIFDEIHSIDSLDLADELNRRLEREKRVMPVFLEVNVSGEESKHGFKVGEIVRAIREIREMRAIKVKGLMTMAPYKGDLEEIRGIFRKLKELADRYNLRTSMGMSNDWKVAVSEGTDMIRIGRVIFK